MLFNSLEFLIFLPIVFGGYWSLSKFGVKVQNWLLIIVSLVFYGWLDWRLCGLLLMSSGCAYGTALLPTSYKKVGIGISLAVNLGILCFFKYFNFFSASLASALSLVGLKADIPTLNLILPIGISFYSFMSISYTTDVYRGLIAPPKDVSAFFAYIMFFPQLLAGPIGRAPQLLPQFEHLRVFNFDQAMHGVCLLLFGLFKKMVVADNLCQYVDKVFLHPAMWPAPTCLIATLFFTIQIYCDFSGYSDTARGVARLFGIELMVNFDRPYLSRTFSEFWRRWHISLSSWFKDYLYIPLGGSRVPFSRIVFNTWVVFLVSGLWHGAAWTFVFWGGLHALYLTCGIVRKKFFNFTLPKFFEVFIVFCGVAFAWIFFKASDFTNLFEFLGQLVSMPKGMTLYQLFGGIGPAQFAFAMLSVVLMCLCGFLPKDCRFKMVRHQIAFSIASIVAIVFLAAPSGGQFIYFQF